MAVTNNTWLDVHPGTCYQFALTLKKSSFLFLLKYKAASTSAGMLVRRLGKLRSSLNLVYLHTLSPWRDERVRSHPASLANDAANNTSTTFEKVGFPSPLGVHGGVEPPRQPPPQGRDQDRRLVARIRHGPHMLTAEDIRLVQGACSENRGLSASLFFDFFL